MSEMDAEGILDPEDPIDDVEDDEGIGGRLVEPGSEDVDDVDDEKDAIAHLVSDDDRSLSAEESAMHITDSP
jgi:hypothetical protein